MSHLFGHDQPLSVQGGGQRPSSFVGSFDPRVRVVAAGLFSVMVVSLHQIEFALAAFSVAVATMFIKRKKVEK